MLSARRWLKKIRKIGSDDQNDGEPNRYMSSKDMRDRQSFSRVLSLAGEVAGPLRLQWSSALEEDHGPLATGGFVFFVYVGFSISSCEMVRWWLHLEIGIRFSPLYPRFNGVSNTDRDAWRCASCRSSRIKSFFVFVGLILG
jgi:hypothetical protein